MMIQKADPTVYPTLMTMMKHSAEAYFEQTLSVMKLKETDFLHLFQTVGTVYTVHLKDALIGFYWLEKREKILHIHGIVLDDPYQGKGYGRKLLETIEKDHSKSVDAFELGVHIDNHHAIELYKKIGYKLIKHDKETDFFIFQKYPLQDA